MPSQPNVALGALYKWDLSSLPGFAGSTVNGAVIRLYMVGGNGKPFLGTVTHHDFDEATVTSGNPGGTAGVLGWGAGSDSLYSLTGDSSVATTTAINNEVVGRGYDTWDATSDVQAMANGTPNYGWASTSVNNGFLSSESTGTGTYGGDPYFAGAGSQPVLFIDYESSLNVFRRLVNPLRVADVTTARMTAFTTKLREQGRSPDTIARHLRHLMVIFRWGSRQGFIAKMPTVEFPKQPKG